LRGGCVRIHPMMDFINKFTTKQGHGKQT
jgi:hypothetical protein